MTKPLNLTEIALLADSMTAALAERDRRMPPSAMAGPGWFSKLSEASAILRQDVEGFGGRFSRAGSDGIAVTLGKLTARSTEGVTGACRNWLTAARKKLEAPDT